MHEHSNASASFLTTRRRFWSRIIVGIVFSYAIVLIAPNFIKISNPLSLTFNSMLDHIALGRFDVDPAVIGKEGFSHDNHVYAYWGVMPAILRLPVTILRGWRGLDFTIPYCLLALFWMGVVKIWTVHFVLRHNRSAPRSLAKAMYVVIALSGAQICFFRFTVYQEVCLWAGLFGALFVAAAIVAQHTGLGERERMVMAIAAGAAMLTRVSTGIGLIAAFGFILLSGLINNPAQRRSFFRQSAAPLLVLAFAILLTAAVNYGRWGDPLTFADYRYYIYNVQYPDRLVRTATYGLFNLKRIPFGIVYYFLPVWVLPSGNGHLFFDAVRNRLIDSAELPPSSFLVTDPLLLVLCCTALAGWCSRRNAGGSNGAAITTGLAIPPLLMLTAISMCFRYRMDFYPLIEFLAFSGLAMVGSQHVLTKPRLVWGLTAVSVLSSALASIAYAVSDLGPAQSVIGQGIGRYYLGRLGLL